MTTENGTPFTESTETISSTVDQSNTSLIEIELDSFSKEDFMVLISAMHERDMTFNEFVVFSLEEMIKKYELLHDDAVVEVINTTDSGMIQTALTDIS